MLSLNIKKLKELMENVDSKEMSITEYSLPSYVIRSFHDCFEGGTYLEEKYLNMYIEGLESIGNSVLDFKNPSLESIMDKCFESISDYNNILVMPINILFHKYQNKPNYILPVEQKFKSQIVNERLSVCTPEIADCLFKLNSMGLFPNEILEMYVSSISMEALLTSSILMNDIRPLTESAEHPMDKSGSSFSNSYFIAFGDNLKVINDFNELINNKVDLLTSELIDDIINDCNSILSLNEVSGEYNKKVVQSYLFLYISTVDEIMLWDKDEIVPNMIILLSITQKIYLKYHHKLTALVMMWLIMTARSVSDCSGINFLSLIDLQLKNLDSRELLQGFGKTNASDVASLIYINNETKDEISKRIPELNNVLSEITDMLLSNNVNKGSAENYGNISELSGESGDQMIKTLTESFEVLKNGHIKINIKGKTTYMDEYAMNHRLLKLNDQQNDIEGMKYNLVYALLLVESIEKNVIHNSKIDKDSALYKDAEKARSFALNDINTYIMKIRRKDHKFDLNKFYKEVKADECSIIIDAPETISGVKKIINAIVM